MVRVQRRVSFNEPEVFVFDILYIFFFSKRRCVVFELKKKNRNNDTDEAMNDDERWEKTWRWRMKKKMSWNLSIDYL